MSAFYSGLEVRYHQYRGFIDFVGEQYITVCIHQFEHKSKDVCLLVYQKEWKNVQLIKESEK